MNRRRLVVVGNGMAGARLVEEVLARDPDRYQVTMFGDEPYGNYNRILLSGVVAGTHAPEDIFINPLEWYRRNQVVLRAGVRAQRIDRARRVVYGDDDTEEPYDRLVLATGSSPFVPRIEGVFQAAAAAERASGGWADAPAGAGAGRGASDNLAPGVFVFRTLDDCTRMVEHASRARRAVVIGGGLLGLEAARGLLNRGLEVHVVHLMGHLMDAQLDPQAGHMLRKTLVEMGLKVHLDKTTTMVVGHGAEMAVRFRDQSALHCDMLVISAGIRPNVALAKTAGLPTNRGIVVDDTLTSSDDPAISAVGECAEHRGTTYGLVAPCWDQARVLAERLTGRNEAARYEGSRVTTKLKVMGVDVTVMGEKEASASDDEIVTYVEPSRGVYKKLVVREGRLAGSILIGDGPSVPALLHAFDRGDPLPANRAEMLFPIGTEPAEVSVEDLPDSIQICNCNGVTKGQLVAAVKGGARSLKVLSSTTRAATGCGTCKPQVEAILEYAGDGLVVEDLSVHYYVPGVPLTKAELVAEIRRRGLRSVSSVFEQLAGGKEDVSSKVGLASLLKTVWGREYEDERDARFINDRVHANIQKDGTFSVVPRIYGGITSASQLRAIADVADRYNVPMVKLTGGQRIDLLGIPKEQLPAVWRDLGMPSGHAYSKAFRTCKTCVGTEFCRYGVGDSTTLGVQIEKRFQGIESPHKLKLACSGCPRNCAEATTKDLGAVAIEGGRWEVYVGGAAGSRVRKGDVLCVVEAHDEVLRVMGRFMQYYRENAKYRERTYDFVERVGIARLRQLLIEDSEGICERLDVAIQDAVDAYVDPWQAEADRPLEPNQFASVVAEVAG